METIKELIEIDKKFYLEHLSDITDFSDFYKKTSKAISVLEQSFCGSWLGYHSTIYYNNFQQIPHNAHFDPINGFNDRHSFCSKTVGEWRQYNKNEIMEFIYSRVNSDFDNTLKSYMNFFSRIFDNFKNEVLSVLSLYKSESDSFLDEITSRIEKLKIFQPAQFIELWKPSKLITSDYDALGSGMKIPTHILVKANIEGINNIIKLLKHLHEFIENLINHIRRKNSLQHNSGINKSLAKNIIFIGHGRSLAWHELKDFIVDKLKLEYDEFDKLPSAGSTIVARLNQMLNNCSFAFLILTAEDELNDGRKQARMNVIHEVGLFQGKLGFNKAIVLLEDGCEEFSNIQGLSQIRFPHDNIKASFEDVRSVLEREQIL